MGIYNHMQAAVDVVHYSEHSENKIAACIVGTDHSGDMFFRVGTNFWPDQIKDTIGQTTRIGNASGTVHAETACLIAAPKTKGASIFITDPCCPNCLKNMAEAGITNIYIDHKGFEKKWAKDRMKAFETISLPIAAAAGIGIHKIFRKNQHCETIIPPNPQKNQNPGNAVRITAAETSNFNQLMHQEIKQYDHENIRFAIALAHNHDDEPYLISSKTHRWPNHGQTGDPEHSKYTFFVNPIKRAMMIAKREGLTIENGNLFSNTVPTAREMVDMIGANLTKIEIGDLDTARSESDIAALHLLTDNGILEYRLTEQISPTP